MISKNMLFRSTWWYGWGSPAHPSHPIHSRPIIANQISIKFLINVSICLLSPLVAFIFHFDRIEQKNTPPICSFKSASILICLLQSTFHGNIRSRISFSHRKIATTLFLFEFFVTNLLCFASNLLVLFRLSLLFCLCVAAFLGNTLVCSEKRNNNSLFPVQTQYHAFGPMLLLLLLPH